MIEVAKIVKPQGIKGEVKCQPLTNILAVFKTIKVCYIDGKMVKILHASVRQDFLYLTIENVTTRNDAEALRGKLICLPKEELLAAKNEEEFLIDDLIGMVLYDTEGKLVGQIKDVVDYGCGDILVIDCNGRTKEAPYLANVFLTQGDKLVVNRKAFNEVAI